MLKTLRKCLLGTSAVQSTVQYERRIEAVRRVLAEEGADVFILTDPKNILYLTGFEDGRLFITQTSEPILTVSALSLEEAEDSACGVQLRPSPMSESMSNFNLRILRDELKPRSIFYDSLPISEYLNLTAEGFKLIDGSSHLSNMRRVKDQDEVSLIRKAAELSSRLMEILIEYVKPGVRECDVAKEADAFLRERGLEPAFPIIVVSGPRTSNPHGKPSLRVISEDDPVTIDLGVKYGGYCADMTRSFIVGRNAEYSKILEDAYDTQNTALKLLRAGVQCKNVDKAARDLLEARGYSGLFIHSLGHGIGLDVHEPPSLNPLSEDTLMENEVVTIEPGIYFKKKLGCRVEDTVLTLKNGCEVLTRTSQENI